LLTKLKQRAQSWLAIGAQLFHRIGFTPNHVSIIGDSIILCGIILGGLTDVKWGLAALVGSMLVSYARARAESAGVKMESVGLAERAERILILTSISLLSYVWIEAINWGILILAVITNVTVIQRALYFRKAAKRIDRL